MRVTGSAVAAAIAVTLAAGPAALGQQLQASAQLSVFIESVSPQWATPGHDVTVTGIVRNGTAAAQEGVSVQLRSSASPLSDRDDLTLYAAGDYPVDMPEGTAVPLPGVIPPGQSVRWRATLNPSAVGMTQFGVYPLAAQILDSVGAPVATDRTFLPFWPGGAASQRPKPLSIAWIWPLIDQPYQAACPALLSGGLASSLASGGRLAELLAAGGSYSAAAHLTWAIDPALVQNVHTMGSPHLTGGYADCSGATAAPASSAARNWLSELSSATSGQQVFLTPYADVDVAALSHDGLDADLRSAFNEGRSVWSADRQVLHLPASTDTIAWPPGGLADSGVLGSLAIDGISISTVVLDSTVMPPSGQVPSYTPSAQTSAPSGVGSSLHVLLADHTISQILGTASTSTADPGGAFATGQRFLAETAMIVAEAPALSRSLVVAPPARWNPAPGLANDLLSETVRAPWLQPTSLADLAAAAHPSGQVPRQAPPADRVSKDELSPAFLRQVARLGAAVKLQASILSPPDQDYLSSAIAALESSAWRGGRKQAAIREDLLSRVLDYVAAQGNKVAIIDSGHITLGGSSGKVPVSISNGLSQTVRVRLHASVPGDGRLGIGPFDSLVTIPPGKTMTVRLPVRASTVGATEVTLGLLSPDGRPLPGTQVQLPVHATRFGTLALVIMSVALAVFVLTSSARAIRRGRKDGVQHDDQASDPPGPAAVTGSVGSGDDLANDHPPEDPDEYADARGRARR